MVNPLPTITVNSGSICKGEKFIITPIGANTYTVTGGNFSVSPNNTTSYSVTGISFEGCSSSKVVSTVTVNACTGLKEQDGNTFNSIKLYPNPSKGNLNLSINLSQDSKLYVELFDCIGRKIQDVYSNENNLAGEITISKQVRDITEGLYIVKITINGPQSVLKWVIENY